MFIEWGNSNQFGVHQNLPDKDDELYEQTKEIIEKTVEYMKNIWVQNTDNNRINYKCRNMNELCSYWALDECGDDDPNAEYMQKNCAPACQTCHVLDSQLRCPMNEEENASIIKEIAPPVNKNTFLTFFFSKKSRT